MFVNISLMFPYFRYYFQWENIKDILTNINETLTKAYDFAEVLLKCQQHFSKTSMCCWSVVGISTKLQPSFNTIQQHFNTISTTLQRNFDNTSTTLQRNFNNTSAHTSAQHTLTRCTRTLQQHFNPISLYFVETSTTLQQKFNSSGSDDSKIDRTSTEKLWEIYQTVYWYPTQNL